MINMNLTEGELQQVYNWVDQIPLSRPKRNMARDFSDAVLMAQIISHFNPKIVQLHNYNATGSFTVKVTNWKTLNRKVLAKIKINLSKEQIESLANSTTGFIEKLIFRTKKFVESAQIPSPSTVSKISKNTNLSFAQNFERQKHLNKMTYKEIKKKKPVAQLVGAKNEEITLLKQTIELSLTKAQKLEQLLKSKDRQIEQLVKMIRDKKI